MENASKALIIAGAILIAILLLSAGIVILNSTSDVTDNAETAVPPMKVDMKGKQVWKANSYATDNEEKNVPSTGVDAELENAEEVLETMDITNDFDFNEYIYNKYGSIQLKSADDKTPRKKECKITAAQVRELCVLVIERNKLLTGKVYDRTETYISSRDYEKCKVYYKDGEYKFDLDDNTYYEVTLEQNWDGGKKNEGVYSVQIRPAD